MRSSWCRALAITTAITWIGTQVASSTPLHQSRPSGLNSVAATGNAQAISDDISPGAVDRVVQSAIESFEQRLPPTVVGLSVAVSQGSHVDFSGGFGFADIAGKIRATAETVFPISSMTKTFTASVVMQLAQAGRLRLTDHIRQFVPGLPWGNKVTIAELLNHTSGIPDYIDSVPGMLGDNCPSPFGSMARCPRFGAAQVLKWLSCQRLQFVPGAQWSYSSSGYYLLGLVIEKVTGQPYANYLSAHILRPLGLDHTSVCPDNPHPPNLAVGYIVSPTTAQWSSVGEGGIPASDGFAAGELCSTATDLVRSMDALTHGRVVSATSYTDMTTPTRLATGASFPYGYGLELPSSTEDVLGQSFPGQPYLGHGGAQAGFTSALVDFPKLDLNIAVLSNTEPAALSVGYVITYGVVCDLLHQGC